MLRQLRGLLGWHTGVLAPNACGCSAPSAAEVRRPRPHRGVVPVADQYQRHVRGAHRRRQRRPLLGGRQRQGRARGEPLSVVTRGEVTLLIAKAEVDAVLARGPVGDRPSPPGARRARRARRARGHPAAGPAQLAGRPAVGRGMGGGDQSGPPAPAAVGRRPSAGRHRAGGPGPAAAERAGRAAAGAVGRREVLAAGEGRRERVRAVRSPGDEQTSPCRAARTRTAG